jgi:hypothetical protein
MLTRVRIFLIVYLVELILPSLRSTGSPNSNEFRRYVGVTEICLRSSGHTIELGREYEHDRSQRGETKGYGSTGHFHDTPSTSCGKCPYLC